jgi:hypothetical protein
LALEEEKEEEELLMFYPWLYIAAKGLKSLLHNNILKHNTIIIAGKTI